MGKELFVVRGIDLLIDGDHVAEGEQVTLDASLHPYLARWLEPVAGQVDGAEAAEEAKAAEAAKAAKAAKAEKEAEAAKAAKAQADDKGSEQ